MLVALMDLSGLVVEFLRRFHARGSQRIVAALAARLPALQSYPLRLSPDTLMRVDLRDHSSVASLFDPDSHDAGQLSVLTHFLPRGSVVYDIGANVGYYTLRLSEPRLLLSHVYAFEPNSDMASRLAANAAHRPSVTVLPVALAASDGGGKFFVKGANSGLGTLRPNAGGTAIRVPLRSLDSLIRDGTIVPPDVIKLDVEGFEYHVLSGYGLRDRHRPAIFFEWLDEFTRPSGLSLTDVRQLLGDQWRLYRVELDGTLRGEEVDSPRSANDLLAVHRDSAHAATAQRLAAGDEAIPG